MCSVFNLCNNKEISLSSNLCHVLLIIIIIASDAQLDHDLDNIFERF